MATTDPVVKNSKMKEQVADLAARRKEAELGGGKKRMDAQSASGKLTASAALTRWLPDRTW